ncbi:MAG: CHAT domain-containing protein [Gammaproteobacteria bacterium]|nr:CHAT domain-containing protein [Gammaproteobacteria bacterium]
MSNQKLSVIILLFCLSLSTACSNMSTSGKNTLSAKPEINTAENKACRPHESAWMGKVRSQAVFSNIKTDDLPSAIDKLLQQSKTWQQSGYYAEAKQMLLQALKLADKAKDKKRSAIVHANLVHVYALQGNTSEAGKHLSRGLADARVFPDVAALMFLSKFNLSLVLHEYEEAKKAFEQSVTFAGKAGLQMLAIKGVINLAMTAFAQKQIPQALGQTTFYKSVGQPMYYQWADILLQRAAKGSNKTLIQEDLRKARDAVEQLKKDELKDYFRDDCVAALPGKSKTVDDVEPGTAVIYPILLDDRIELLISLSKRSIRRFGKAISKKEVHKTVTAFQESLQKTESDEYEDHARRLYSWLIEPLKKHLAEHKIKTLIFVPEGPLRTIPMAALHDGRQFLIEQYALAITPGLTLTMPDSKLPRSEDIPGLLTGLTEVSSVYEEEGLWSPLLYSEAEVDDIGEVYPNHQKLTGELFTKKRLTANIGTGGFAVIHISSHAKFEENPEDSFVLTYGNKLKLNELGDSIKSAIRRKNPIELLTLSACETAKGDNERAALGLSGITVKSGARSALAALWFVDEQATYQVVSRFYENLKGNANKAQALRKAQKALLDSHYDHPYYWAPFLLIGNWS